MPRRRKHASASVSLILKRGRYLNPDLARRQDGADVVDGFDLLDGDGAAAEGVVDGHDADFRVVGVEQFLDHAFSAGEADQHVFTWYP